MSSTRAQDVAEVLWELKRADKVATFSVIAERAGFSAGSTGRAMNTAMKKVRKDWPHLQWWRAINDKQLIPKDGEQEALLREFGLDFAKADTEDEVVVEVPDEQMMSWKSEEEPAETDAEAPA